MLMPIGIPSMGRRIRRTWALDPLQKRENARVEAEGGKRSRRLRQRWKPRRRSFQRPRPRIDGRNRGGYDRAAFRTLVGSAVTLVQTSPHPRKFLLEAAPLYFTLPPGKDEANQPVQPAAG